jgi:hypothetical protein
MAWTKGSCSRCPKHSKPPTSTTASAHQPRTAVPRHRYRSRLAAERQDRLTIDTKLKPGLGHIPITRMDARVTDRLYAALRKGGNARSGGGALSASRVRDVHAILSGTLGLAARWT